jgi:Zn-finger nucleic acid-binding protein
MNCIRCNVPLTRKNYEGVEIDQCAKCGGVWLDEGELQQVINRQEEGFSPEIVQAAVRDGFAGIPRAEEQSLERCPKCGAQMTAVNYAYHSGIIIDRCPQQHGLWFDGLEMEKIQANQEHWKREIEEHKNSYLQKMKNVEAANHVAVQEMGDRAEQVPSRFFMNRIVGALMKIFD